MPCCANQAVNEDGNCTSCGGVVFGDEYSDIDTQARVIASHYLRLMEEAVAGLLTVSKDRALFPEADCRRLLQMSGQLGAIARKDGGMEL